MATLNVVMITAGQVVAYGIGAAFENTHGGWRWMVGLGSVPAGLQCIFLFFLPESRKCLSCTHGPVVIVLTAAIARVLLRKGRSEQAENVLKRIYAHATEEQVGLKVKVLQTAVQESIDITNSTTLFQRTLSVVSVPVNRRALSMSLESYSFCNCLYKYILFKLLLAACKLSSNYVDSTRLCTTQLRSSSRLALTNRRLWG